MDLITQGLLGAAIGEAGFRPKLGWRAVPFGAFCGFFPDLDVITRYISDTAFLIHHRGFSHSFFFLILITPLFGWFGYLWGRKKSSYQTWAHLTFWALITHALLDLCTAYGTQIFWPFTDKRYAIDAVSVLDLFYSIPLLILLVVAAIPKISIQFRQRFSWVIVIVTTLYLGTGFLLSFHAQQLAEKKFRESAIQVKTVRAMPTLLNILVWRIVAHNEQGDLFVGLVSVWSPENAQFKHLAKPKDPAVEIAINTEKGEIFRWFSMDSLSYEIVETAVGKNVIMTDQRFGLFTKPTENSFNAVVALSESGEPIGFYRGSRRRNVDLYLELATLWEILAGNK